MTKATHTEVLRPRSSNPLWTPPLPAFCRSLGGIGRAAALRHLLRGVRLGWEFTPGGAASTRSAGVPVSNGPVKGRRHQEEKLVQRKPTLLLLHGFMGSKVCWKTQINTAVRKGVSRTRTSAFDYSTPRTS